MNEHRLAEDPRGQVVITRFECHSLLRLLVVMALHRKVKKETRRVTAGYLGGTTIVGWRHRTVLSISMWDRLESIYDMGAVKQHIIAARAPTKLGVATVCGIYPYGGEWKTIMFAVPESDTGEPLFAIDTNHGTTLRSPA